MALRNISQITCSLNLGLIFAADYSYDPNSGVTITLTFASQNGTYTKPTLLQKAFIQIGGANFSMYAVASRKSLASGRRVMEVVFVDEFFQLDNYLVVLTGRGCGEGVYELGTPVDNRTEAQKVADALDPIAQQIATLTQFPDVQYTFNDFLAILRQKFTVQVSATYSTTITNDFTGTFGDVLSAWCNFFNLAFFFENSIIKIFNPTTLTITLPTEVSLSTNDIISFEEEEDIRSTYNKTCFNWFQQEGGQFALNQTTNDNGALLTRTETLFPIGYEFNLHQTSMSLTQVAAAQFGEQFWFLYNYYNGSEAANCGWAKQTATSDTVFTSATNLGLGVTKTDPDAFQQRYDAFRGYGDIAGRWYLSNEKSSLAVDTAFNWFDESEGQIFTFSGALADSRALDPTFLAPTNQGVNSIPGTHINQYYSGVNYVGNRMAYRDDRINATDFTLTTDQQNLVNQYFDAIYSAPGSNAMPFAATLGNGSYAGYQNIAPTALPDSLKTLFNGIPAMTTGFQSRFLSVPIKGIAQEDYISMKASQNEPSEVEIVNGADGPNVVSNTAVIKTRKQGAYTVYYNKYAQCGSAASQGNYFNRRFEPNQISSDVAISFEFSKQANNTYRINRDYSTLNALVNNPLLPQLAQARPFSTHRVSFTVNYFRDIPLNFLTNGLVNMSISIGDAGVTASYTFSNEVLQVPNSTNRANEFEQQIRNSWIRQYRPNQVIT